MRRTERCKVSLDFILGISAFELRDSVALEMIREGARHDHDAHPSSHHMHGKEGHQQASEGHLSSTVGTVTVKTSKRVDLGALEKWLGELLWEESPSGQKIFRMKGIVAVRGKEEKYILQAVHDLFECQPADCGAESTWVGSKEKPLTQIVIIGEHLRLQSLEQGLHACCI